MLNFTIKVFALELEYKRNICWLPLKFQLISDAGFQGEITSISTAAQQIEVFSRILKTSVGHYLESSDDDRQKHIQECAVSNMLYIW